MPQVRAGPVWVLSGPMRCASDAGAPRVRDIHFGPPSSIGCRFLLWPSHRHCHRSVDPRSGGGGHRVRDRGRLPPGTRLESPATTSLFVITTLCRLRRRAKSTDSLALVVRITAWLSLLEAQLPSVNVGRQ